MQSGILLCCILYSSVTRSDEAGMGEKKLGIEQHPVSAYVAAKELLSQKQRAEQW